MNYRHAFHAGNFADVYKHIVLTRIIEYLKRKDGAFRVYDTHAGSGIYDLSSAEAAKTGEWISGIGRLIGSPVPTGIAGLIAPYVDIVLSFADGELLRSYPGSPMIARRLLRKQDRLALYELHPQDADELAELFAGDYQVRVNQLDGWLVCGAHLPPKEKRGMVLIDPPFEEPGDFDRIVSAIGKADRLWPGGTILAWYPVKHDRQVIEFKQTLRQSSHAKIVSAEIRIAPPGSEPVFRGCGVVIKNPPYTLAGEMATILPFLCERLGKGRADHQIEWLRI